MRAPKPMINQDDDGKYTQETERTEDAELTNETESMYIFICCSTLQNKQNLPINSYIIYR